MGLITIDKNKCNQDGICISECPTRVLMMDKTENCPVPLAEFDEYCIRCGHCVAVCPTGALRLDWLDPENCPVMDKNLAVTPAQAEQFLMGRRSIRTFKNKTIARETLEKLLEVACSAPSAKNMQPWHWIVIQTPEEVRRLSGLVVDWMQGMLDSGVAEGNAVPYQRVISAWNLGIDRVCREAPHLIIAHADKDWLFAPEDTALALSLLELYAVSLGLGVCWGGYLYKAINASPALFETLGLPQNHLAFGAVMLGYPKFRYQRIPLRNRPIVTWK
jgi:nitroreductase/NAD-dependent dihydropyrimidine dehydrogenase PreA subunit